jgi:hypothetical protein
MDDDFDNDDLFFAEIVTKAEVLSLLAILDELARHAGYRDPDGLSLPERFYRQRTVELENLFRSLENGNPRLAARLYARYQEARQSLGEDRS